jgi:hypothetical protein
MWRVRVTTDAVETQQRSLCVDELHVTVNYINIWSAAERFCAKCMSPKTLKRS